MNTEARKSVVVIGVGNRALSDEGVGCRVVCRVASRASSHAEVIDAGLPGPGLASLLQGREKAIIVDAVDADMPPGTVYRFVPDEVVSTQARGCISLHEGNLLHYVELAEALGMSAKEVVIVGIQPEKFSPGEQLSAPVEKAVPKAAETVLEEIGIHNWLTAKGVNQ